MAQLAAINGACKSPGPRGPGALIYQLCSALFSFKITSIPIALLPAGFLAQNHTKEEMTFGPAGSQPQISVHLYPKGAEKLKAKQTPKFHNKPVGSGTFLKDPLEATPTIGRNHWVKETVGLARTPRCLE